MFKFDFALDGEASSGEEQSQQLSRGGSTRAEGSGEAKAATTAASDATSVPTALTTNPTGAGKVVVKLGQKLNIKATVSSSATTPSTSTSSTHDASSVDTTLNPATKEDALKRAMPAEQKTILKQLDDKAVQRIVATEYLPGRTEVNETFSETVHKINEISDVVAGVYEGGLKKWECSDDLVRYMQLCNEAFPLASVANSVPSPLSKQLAEAKKSKTTKLMDLSWIPGARVLDLGCGHGLPGIYCAQQNAAVVAFQDLNEEVLASVTTSNVIERVGGRAIHRKAMALHTDLPNEVTTDSHTSQQLTHAVTLLNRLERTIESMSLQEEQDPALAANGVVRFEFMKARLRSLLRNRIAKLRIQALQSEAHSADEKEREDDDKAMEEIEELLEFLEDFANENEIQNLDLESAKNDEERRRILARRMRGTLATTEGDILREFSDEDEDEDADLAEDEESVDDNKSKTDEQDSQCASAVSKESAVAPCAGTQAQESKSDLDDEAVEVPFVLNKFRPRVHCQFFAGSWSDPKLWDLTLAAHSSPILNDDDVPRILPKFECTARVLTDTSQLENEFGEAWHSLQATHAHAIEYIVVSYRGELPVDPSDIAVVSTKLETLTISPTVSPDKEASTLVLILQAVKSTRTVVAYWLSPSISLKEPVGLTMFTQGLKLLLDSSSTSFQIMISPATECSLYEACLYLDYVEASWKLIQSETDEERRQLILTLHPRRTANTVIESSVAEREIIRVTQAELSSSERYHLILTGDTLYFPQSYVALVNYIRAVLHRDGVALIGAKRYYFGVGGSIAQFTELIKAKVPDMELEVVEVIDDGKSNLREILALRWKGCNMQ